MRLLYLTAGVIGAVALALAVSINSTLSPVTPSNHVTVDRNAFRLTVSTDQARYAPGEPVHVTARLEWRGASPFQYHAPTPCTPDLRFQLDTPTGPLDLTLWNQPPLVCIQVIDERTLEPGASRRHIVTWNQQLRAGDGTSPAPAGRYTVAVRFPPGAIAAAVAFEIRA